MTGVFAKPDYTPAISAAGDGQQAVQQATFATRGESAGSSSDPMDDLAYEAYKLGQEAMGLPAVSRRQWAVMFKMQQLLNR